MAEQMVERLCGSSLCSRCCVVVPDSSLQLRIPKHLLAEVNMHIPRCQWFPLGKCRKGSACRKLHDVSGEVPDSAHLAKVSRCRDASDRHSKVLSWHQQVCDFGHMVAVET